MKVKDCDIWKGFEMLEELDAFATWMNHHLLRWNLPEGWKGKEMDEQRKERARK